MNTELISKNNCEIVNTEKNYLNWNTRYNYQKIETIHSINNQIKHIKILDKETENRIKEMTEKEKEIAKILITKINKNNHQIHLQVPKQHYISGVIHRIIELVIDNDDVRHDLILAIDEAIGNIKRYDNEHKDFKLSIFYLPDQKIQLIIGDKDKATENISDQEIKERNMLPDLMEENKRGFFFMKQIEKNGGKLTIRRTPYRINSKYNINGRDEEKQISLHAYFIEQDLKDK
jgi:anti-sigma regulatory factor (Ser/Thr protein kinase)